MCACRAHVQVLTARCSSEATDHRVPPAAPCCPSRDPARQTLRLRCMDFDVGEPTDDFLGSTVRDLRDICDGREHELEMELRGSSFQAPRGGDMDSGAGDGGSSSTVQLTCRFFPFSELLAEGVPAELEGKPLLGTPAQVGWGWGTSDEHLGIGAGAPLDMSAACLAIYPLHLPRVPCHLQIPLAADWQKLLQLAGVVSAWGWGARQRRAAGRQHGPVCSPPCLRRFMCPICHLLLRMPPTPCSRPWHLWRTRERIRRQERILAALAICPASWHAVLRNKPRFPTPLLQAWLYWNVAQQMACVAFRGTEQGSWKVGGAAWHSSRELRLARGLPDTRLGHLPPGTRCAASPPACMCLQIRPSFLLPPSSLQDILTDLHLVPAPLDPDRVAAAPRRAGMAWWLRQALDALKSNLRRRGISQLSLIALHFHCSQHWPRCRNQPLPGRMPAACGAC